MVINTNAKTWRFMNQVHLNLFSHLNQVELQLEELSLTFKVKEDVDLECIILGNQSIVLLTNHLTMLLCVICQLCLVLKILSWNNTMDTSKISFKIFSIVNTKVNLMLKDYGMNTDLLMILLLKWWKVMVDSLWLLKIMMVMFNQMLLLKDMVH